MNNKITDVQPGILSKHLLLNSSAYHTAN